MLFLLVLSLSACSAVGSEEEGNTDFADALGTVQMIESGGEGAGGEGGHPPTEWIIKPESRSGMGFCLEEGELPEELKQEGAQVTFTGNAEEVPENVRLACLPLELIEIQKAK